MRHKPEHPELNEILTQIDWLRGLARHLVGADAADDVVQDAVLLSLQNPPDKPRSMGNWLAKVARNRAADIRRRESTRSARELRANSDKKMVEEDVVEQVMVQRQLTDAVLDLPDPYRECILLRYYRGFNATEVGRQLDVPNATVRSRLKRGLELLRKRMDTSSDRDWRLALVPLITKAASKGAIVMGIKTKAVLTVLALAAMVAGWQSLPDESPAPVSPLEAAAGEATSREPLASSKVAKVTTHPFEEEVSSSAMVEPVVAAEGAVIRGFVRTAKNQPVSDAQVFIGAVDLARDLQSLNSIAWVLSRHGIPTKMHPRGLKWLFARTDKSGAFEFSALPLGTNYHAAAYHPKLGVACASNLPVSTEEETEVELNFHPSIVVFGKVTEADGTPVPNAGLLVANWGDQDRQVSAIPTTDDEGNYRTIPIPGAEFRASCRHEGYFKAWVNPMAAEPGAREMRIDLELHKTRKIKGRFWVGPDESTPLTKWLSSKYKGQTWIRMLNEQSLKVSCHWSQLANEPNAQATAQTGGRVWSLEDRYEIPLTGADDYIIALWAGPRLLGQAEFGPEDTVVDIHIDPSRISKPLKHGTLSFTARSDFAPDDSPNFRLDIVSTEPGPSGRKQAIHLNAEAGKVTQPLNEGSYYLRAHSPGMAAAIYRIDIRPNETTEHEHLWLPADARISGVVLSDTGEPINDAEVYVLPANPGLHIGRAIQSGATDATGRFTIKGLSEGKYLVLAWQRGWCGTSELAMASVDQSLPLNLTFSKGIEYRLTANGSSGPFMFQVVDPRGFHIRDDRIRFNSSRGSGFPVRTPPSPCTIIVSCPGFAEARLEMTPGDPNTLKFDLKPLKQ